MYSPKTPGGNEVADMILSDNYYDAEDDGIVVKDDGSIVENNGVEDEV